MRKEIIGAETAANVQGGAAWLDLASIARVQLSSEDPAFPIENALSINPEHAEAEWRAGAPGPQTIAILFDAPQALRRISLRFHERQVERSQEFLLRFSSAQETNRDIVRQQWSFSPTGSAQGTGGLLRRTAGRDQT